MMLKVLQNCRRFLRNETVLCAAVFLALVSAAFVPPSLAYVAYIDWDTLALLFSLMAVMKGFQKAGVFVYLGNQLLKRAANTRKLLFVLVFLPFVCSMVITNDVSLLTFVPFGLVVLRMAGQEHLMVPMVAMQTVAANMGSALTPMGNPQNLYLYTRSGIGFGALALLMLPYVLISAASLVLLIVFRRSAPVSVAPVDVRLSGGKTLLCCGAGFALCLLGIFNILPPLVIAAVTAVFLLFADRGLLAEIDYSLLGTFFAFFIFIGNIGCIDSFKNFLAGILTDHVELVAVLASQVISNVPAALLLSGFTTRWPELIVGCNLGGLGTLIASMASLISYKLVAKDDPARRREYLVWFSVYNIILLAVLLAVSLFL